jgi:hypothetical protein
VPTSTLTFQAFPQSQRDRRSQTFAGKAGKLSRKLVRFIVLDVEMHGLCHGRNVSKFYHHCKTDDPAVFGL